MQKIIPFYGLKQLRMLNKIKRQRVLVFYLLRVNGGVFGFLTVCVFWA